MTWSGYSMWYVFGFVAQAVFAARFIVQWIASERKGRSVVPMGFWILSLCGSAMLLGYAIHRRDPVFVLGQTFGFFIYVRNLMLLHRERTVQAKRE